MRRILCSAIVLVVVTVLLGCDRPPPPPRTAEGGVVRSVAVNQDNPDEVGVVTDYETARVHYEFRLEVLERYYRRTGKVDKLRWAQRERQNLERAQTFEFEGTDDVLPPEGEPLAGADERMLVEQAVSARREYLQALDALAEHYEGTGEEFKLMLANNIRERFDPIRTYMYFLDAEIPPADLTPAELIPAAEQLFEEAYELHRAGKGLPLMADYDRQRQALLKFLRMVREYPSSERIAEAAFYIAEIYKEYFNENVRAAHWYQRAWQWDPGIDKPAYLQAAILWDHRLHNKSRAVELYRQAIRAGRGDVRYARNRLAELTE